MNRFPRQIADGGDGVNYDVDYQRDLKRWKNNSGYNELYRRMGDRAFSAIIDRIRLRGIENINRALTNAIEYRNRKRIPEPKTKEEFQEFVVDTMNSHVYQGRLEYGLDHLPLEQGKLLLLVELQNAISLLIQEGNMAGEAVMHGGRKKRQTRKRRTIYRRRT